MKRWHQVTTTFIDENSIVCEMPPLLSEKYYLSLIDDTINHTNFAINHTRKCNKYE